LFSVSIEPIDKTAIISFSGNNFTSYVEVLKDNHVHFDPDMKVWVCSCNKLLSMLDEINAIEPYVPNETLMKNLLLYQHGEKETRFIRRKFRAELLKAPPLGEYQVEDVKKTIMQNRLILGHDVGLGKTYIAISALNHLIADGEVEKVFILTVPETVYNWKRELMLFSGFNEEDILIVTKDNRDFVDSWVSKKIIITTYNTFVLSSDYYYKQSHNGKKSSGYRTPQIDFTKWGGKLCLIMDEGHKAKSKTSRTFKTLKMHKYDFFYRYILTATPYPNDISEVWSLMYLLDEGVLGNDYMEFLHQVAAIGNKFSAYAVNYFRTKEVEKVVDKLKPFLIKRFKKECLPDLPEMTIKKIYVEPTKEILSIYIQVIQRELASLKEEDGVITPRKVMNKFPYLTLACSDPVTLKGKLDEATSFSLVKQIEAWDIKRNPKIAIVDGLLEEHKSEKVILWSTHPATIDALAEYYKKYNPIVVHGQTDTEGMIKGEFRDKALTKFRTSKDCNLAIISPLCLGTGVNIPESSVAIHWDRNYSAVVYLQALGRNHRATSKKDVVNYILLLDETLELTQDNILDGKKDLNEKLMLKDKLSNEEWRSIFKGKTDIDIDMLSY
jgi:SNF2 family DNA or RNA helicase